MRSLSCARRLIRTTFISGLFSVTPTTHAATPGFTLLKEYTVRAPGEICLWQTAFHRWVSETEGFSLYHLLPIDSEHQGTPGTIFVWFERSSAPGTRAFLAGEEWTPLALEVPPEPYVSTEKLSAVYQVTVEALRQVVDDLGTDGNLIVGYGLHKGGSAAADAFREMLDARRYEGIWSAGVRSPHSSIELCFTVTGISSYAMLISPASRAPDTHPIPDADASSHGNLE